MTVFVGRCARAASAYALLGVVALSLTLCRGAFSEWIMLGDAAASAAPWDATGTEAL